LKAWARQGAHLQENVQRGCIKRLTAHA